MSNMIHNEYMPDFVSPPGETLLETLEAIGMTQAELAERMGRPKKTINEIIKGKAAITPETALQLERVLGIPAHFWNNREHRYRESLARIEEQERLEQNLDWLKRFPIRAMIRLKWISESNDKVQQLRELLNFFGVASPQQWEDIWLQSGAIFRRSKALESAPESVAAWLRKGELEGRELETAPYNKSRFQEALRHIRLLTTKPPETFQPEMVNYCAQAGVAVVFVRELPGTRISGATRWLSPDTALIQLSLRYKTDDQLWFSFFHEAGHILSHAKKDVFIDIWDQSEGKKEQEADSFATNFLIPPAEWKEFTISLSGKNISVARIEKFARKVGITPGIVTGRLQHAGFIPFSHCNKLKRRFRWAEN